MARSNLRRRSLSVANREDCLMGKRVKSSSSTRIRTLERASPLTVFKTVAFVRSATLPTPRLQLAQGSHFTYRRTERDHQARSDGLLA